MKFAVLFVLSCVLGVALSQSACCAPKQWSTMSKTFSATGLTEEDYLIVDGVNEQVYIFIYTEGFQFQVWVENNTVYQYDVIHNTCRTNSGSYNPFCVGYDNDTLLTTVFINQAQTWVWQRTNTDGSVNSLAVDENCFPVGVETDSSDGIRFLHFDLVYNTTMTVNTIPPIPSVCNQGTSGTSGSATQPKAMYELQGFLGKNIYDIFW